MKHIQIRMKLIKDTRKECRRRRQVWQLYCEGRTRPHFQVPAVVSHLQLIAAEPLTGWEDFKAIGWHGTYGRQH